MALKYGLREMATAFVVPAAYGLLFLFVLAAIFCRLFVWVAAVFLAVLLVIHWIDGVRDGDPLWPYRAIFRPIEGFAGLFGLFRGIVRYGVRGPPAT
jgi:hypothetical protein